MSSLTFNTVSFFFFFTNLGLVYSCCADGWTSFGGSCYFFGHHNLNFQDADRSCQHYGAHLVIIETKSENIFLKSHLGTLKDNNHWIGLTDEVLEGTWKWYSNDSIATGFTDWGSGQPNDHRHGNCAAIWASFQYKWVDESCTHLFKPLCEKRYGYYKQNNSFVMPTHRWGLGNNDLPLSVLPAAWY